MIIAMLLKVSMRLWINRLKIFDIVTDMDLVSYPDSYDPLEGQVPSPDHSFDLKI